MHSFTAALLQRQASTSNGTHMDTEDPMTPRSAIGQEERRNLRGQGVDLLSTVHGDEEGFVMVTRRRSARTLPKMTGGGAPRRGVFL